MHEQHPGMRCAGDALLRLLGPFHGLCSGLTPRTTGW